MQTPCPALFLPPGTTSFRLRHHNATVGPSSADKAVGFRLNHACHNPMDLRPCLSRLATGLHRRNCILHNYVHTDSQPRRARFSHGRTRHSAPRTARVVGSDAALPMRRNRAACEKSGGMMNAHGVMYCIRPRRDAGRCRDTAAVVKTATRVDAADGPGRSGDGVQIVQVAERGHRFLVCDAMIVPGRPVSRVDAASCRLPVSRAARFRSSRPCTARRSSLASLRRCRSAGVGSC